MSRLWLGSRAMSRLDEVFEASEELNRRTILETLLPTPGGTLVDLGCGDGTFTERVAARVQPARTIGVELISQLADAAEARGIEVVRGSLGDPLPFDDGSIDVIHSNQVIEHLVDTDRFMAEMARVLRPGGHAVVSTNNLASAHNIFSLLAGWQPTPCHVSDQVVGIGNPLNPRKGDVGAVGQMHLRVFTGRGLAELARHHGLQVEVVVTDGFYPLPPRFARLLTRVLPRHGAFLVQRYRASPGGASATSRSLSSESATHLGRTSASLHFRSPNPRHRASPLREAEERPRGG